MADKKKITKKEEKKVRSTSSGQKIEELRAQAMTLRNDITQLQLDNEQRKLKNTSSLTLKRKELARLLTAMRQVELVTYAKNI